LKHKQICCFLFTKNVSVYEYDVRAFTKHLLVDIFGKFWRLRNLKLNYCSHILITCVTATGDSFNPSPYATSKASNAILRKIIPFLEQGLFQLLEVVRSIAHFSYGHVKIEAKCRICLTSRRIFHPFNCTMTCVMRQTFQWLHNNGYEYKTNLQHPPLETV
jgi:hypothetical protein